MKKKNILIITLLILFLIVTVLVITNSIKPFDDSIYNLLISLRSDFVDNFFKFITKFGNTITVITGTILLLILLKKDDKVLLLSSIISIVSTNQIIKHIIRRERPNHLRLIKQGGFSYPSGHAMVSIALYGILIYIVNKNIKNKVLRIILSILLILLIIGIGLSRIYVGVHYPSDILSGYILAIVILILIIDHFRGNINDKDGSK